MHRFVRTWGRFALIVVATLVFNPGRGFASPAVEAHVPAAAYCCHGYANDTVSSAAAAPYITWASSPDNAGADADRAAGIENIYYYVDVSRVYQGDHAYAAVDGGKYRSTRAVNCSGDFVRTTTPPGYLTDPHRPETLHLLNEELTYHYYPAYTAYFIDDVDAYRFKIANGPPCNGSPLRPWMEPAAANAYAEQLAAARIDQNGRTSVPRIIFNGLSDYADKRDLHEVPLVLLSPANVIGGMCEDCFGSNSPDSLTCGNEWQDDEDLEIKTIRLHKIFWLYVKYVANNPAARLYTFASYMLDWDPKYSVYQTAYAPQNRGQLHVTPETGLVAYDPLKSDISSVNQLLEGGIYVREYRRCYYRRAPVGPCAFLVNSDRFLPRFTPRLVQSYGHTLSLHGGMVLEGGTVSFDGPAASGLIGPQTGEVLLR